MKRFFILLFFNSFGFCQTYNYTVSKPEISDFIYYTNSEIELIRDVDDFTGEINISSPIFRKCAVPFVIQKTITKLKKTYYYLSLRTYGNTLNVNEKVISVIFEDGTKWSKQSKIDADYDDGSYIYSAFIGLSQNDLEIFSTKKIKKFRLYIYDKEININDAEKFCEYVKLIKSAK
jgi:hypothetical protein